MSQREYPINYFREAFQLPINLIFITISFILFISSIILNFYFQDSIHIKLPSESILAIAFGIEMIALSIIAQNPYFQKNIQKKYISQNNVYRDELEIAELISKLSSDSLKRFIKFFNRKNQLLQKTIDLGASNDGIFMIVKENTDKLTKSYAQHLLINQLYHKQLYHVNTEQLQNELKQIQSEIVTSDVKKKALLQQRLDLLKKRIQKITSLREDFSVVELQLKTIEDTLEYLYENSLSKSNIQNFVNAIDEIHIETEVYQDALKEIQELI